MMRQLSLLLMAVVLLVACGPEAPPRSAAPDRPTAQPTAASLAVDTRRALGDPNAPITIVEYSDFQ
ncbi:MAG TPA: hypothetical protein VFS21_25700 [Roseiflexaceae bacterium]|nr:hypothetical protein [Roseiflexaceae bacterium]